jgi:membrane peptidoglycan carboxypeptidase
VNRPRRGRGRVGRRAAHCKLLWRVAVGVVLLAVALSLAAVGYELALPGVTDAPTRVAAIVGSHDGVLGRLPVPTKLGDAIVAVEDEHFYSNVFLNVFDGAARAAVASVRTSSDPGGSTIDQQLAKQLYPGGAGIGGTLQEIALGVKLSLTFSKPEILEMYLNAIYFGHGYWGYVAAAHGYFALDPRQLTWAEASLLAGLPQAPSAYDPIRNLALAKQRQRHVLEQLVVNHYLTAAAARAAFRVRLPLRRPS